MGSELQIDVSQESGRVPVTVFSLKGEISSDNHDQLQAQANESYAAGMRYLLVDFTELTFMSSAGLRALHAIYQKLQGEDDGGEAAGGEFKSPYLKLLNPPDKIRKVINVVGFDRYVEIHTDLEEAIASF